MCRAADCDAVRRYPNPCPTYHALREALVPTNAELPENAVAALFWLAHQLGGIELRAREWDQRQLVALFAAARHAAIRAAETARVEQAIPRGGRNGLVKALQNVPLTDEERCTLDWLSSCSDASIDEVVSIVIKATTWLARANAMH
jgi:hypothetical protein